VSDAQLATFNAGKGELLELARNQVCVDSPFKEAESNSHLSST